MSWSPNLLSQFPAIASRYFRFLGLCLCVLSCELVFAAEPAKSGNGPVGLPGVLSPSGDLGSEARPVDVESQLREIENTKKLMKALGELHGQAQTTVPGPAAGQGGPESAKVPQGAGIQPSPGVGVRDTGGLELPRVPSEDLRALAGGISQAARAVGIDPASTSSASTTSGDPRNVTTVSNGEQGPQARAYSPGDQELLNGLLEKFIDEVMPWVVVLAGLFGIGYLLFSWMTSRVRRAAPSSARGHAASKRRRRSSRSMEPRHRGESSLGRSSGARVRTGD